MDRNGTHVRAVRGPEALELFWIGDGHVRGVDTDALDVNYLVRYRIAPVLAAGS